MKLGFVPHLWTRMDEKAHVVVLEFGKGFLQFPDKGNFAEASIGSERQKIVLGVVEKVNGAN